MAEETTQQTTGAPNFNEMELEVLKFWDENETFQKSLEQTKNGTPYVFYDGPPFATGLPHYGHILGSTIKDLVGRYQTMKGNYVRRVWGWDCHGLPIENIVEQNLKISGKKQIEEIGVDRFNKVCRDNVMNFAHEWGKMVRRMGRWVEFENSYKTMDTSYMESVWWGLKQTWNKGLIYEDRKVLLYCSRCETPISNFEVAMDNSYKDVTEDSVYVTFKLLPRQRIVNDLTDDRTYLIAWTTTPWTLPGNTSLNIGQDIQYVMVEQNEKRYIVAKDRLEILQGPYEIVMEILPRSLEGLQYEPLYPAFAESLKAKGIPEHQMNRLHRIYVADFVTTTDGSGVVHNAAMYGEEDFQLAKQKDLPRVDMLDHKGHYLPYMPENLRGVFFKNADKIVLKELSEKGLVYQIQSYTHSYPHCHRCGTPLYYNALPAWFINIQKIKPQLLKANQDTNWYPGHLKEGRFAKSMEQAPDWNISRNRYWATPLPFWKHTEGECRHVMCVGSVKELVLKSTNFDKVYPNFQFLISNFQTNPNYQISKEELESLDLHKPYIDEILIRCDLCGGEMKRINEVVDCWVESASMPFAELHAPFENRDLFDQRFPADFVAEYIAQTRAWFYVMHVMNTILFDRAPFKNVVTTGTVLAEDGNKMSKSKNNFPDPNILIEKYGIDAIRFYLLTSPVMNADDLNFSEKNVNEVNKKVSLILYNVWTFYRMYEKGQLETSTNEQVTTTSHILDKWVMAKLHKTHKEVTAYLDTYNSVKAGKAVADFVNELSTWYVRRSRDRMKSGGQDAQQALTTLGYALSEVCKMLAPFMPFLADKIYKDVTGQESVHLVSWTKAIPGEDEKLLESMEGLRELVEAGLSLRKDAGQKVRQPLLAIAYKTQQPLSSELEAILLEEMNVKAVMPFNEVGPTQGWVMKDLQQGKIALNTHITEELKREGVARELERQIQDLRKKSTLKVGELVDVYYNATDEQLEDALLTLVDRKKTFVNQITKSLEVEVDYEIQAEVDGKAIWLGIVKI